MVVMGNAGWLFEYECLAVRLRCQASLYRDVRVDRLIRYAVHPIYVLECGKCSVESGYGGIEIEPGLSVKWLGRFDGKGVNDRSQRHDQRRKEIRRRSRAPRIRYR